MKFFSSVYGSLTLTDSDSNCEKILKHFDTLFYSSEEHFISDNFNKVSKCFNIVKGPPIQSLLQIISPCLRLSDIIL